MADGDSDRGSGGGTPPTFWRPEAALGQRLDARLGRLGAWAWANAPRLLSVAVVFGALLYGWMRICEALFYNQLALNPEDIGLGYPGGVPQAVLAVVLLFAVWALVGGLFVLIVALPGKLPGTRSALRVMARIGGGRLMWLSVLAALALAASGSLFSGALGNVVVAVMSPICIVLALALAHVWIGEAGPRDTVLVIGMLAAVVTVGDLPNIAAKDGANARTHGKTPSALTPLFFPWGARQAQVHWTVAPPRGLRSDCVLFLGDGRDGSVVLTSDTAGHRRTMTIPKEKGLVVLVTDPKSRRCPWPRLKRG